MSVVMTTDSIVLSGVVRVEDAETLLAALIDHPCHKVDVSDLTHAPLAVVQLLHAAARPLTGQPASAFLREHALTGLIQIRERKFDTGGE